MIRAFFAATCAWVAFGLVACSSSDKSDSSSGGSGGTSTSGGSSGSGATSSGGSAAVSSGGTGASGGSGASGGTTSGGSSGASGSGQLGGNGGTGATGGSSGSGGTAAGGSSAGTSAMSAGGAGPLGGSGGTGTSGAGGSAMAGMSGAPMAGSGGATFVEPTLVTSAPNAYWKEGTLTEVTSGNADVTVNDTTTYQTWQGFGGSFSEAGWDVLTLLSDADRARALNLLFAADGAHFAYGRVPIGANDYAIARYTLDENANDYSMNAFSIDHDQSYVIPYVKAALAINPSLHLWASPWTPPTWMKDNSAFDGGNMKDDAQTLTAYALYLAKFVEEYKKVGIKIDAVHHQNEPNYETRYPSCLWSAALYTKFIRDYLGPTFASRNVNADIYLGTMSNADAGKDGTIISTVTADASAMAFVKGFGLQWNMIDSVAGLKSKNLPIVQTEHKCGNYPWETSTFNPDKPPNDQAYGVESWGLIVDWLTAGATVYSAWNMVLDTNGKNLDTQRPWPQNALLVVDRTSKTLTLTPAYYVFRHLSEFVDPGAKRVGTTGGDALAFKNPDGTLVAVMYNSGAAKQSIVAIGGKKVQFNLPSNGWATVNLK